MFFYFPREYPKTLGSHFWGTPPNLLGETTKCCFLDVMKIFIYGLIHHLRRTIKPLFSRVDLISKNSIAAKIGIPNSEFLSKNTIIFTKRIQYIFIFHKSILYIKEIQNLDTLSSSCFQNFLYFFILSQAIYRLKKTLLNFPRYMRPQFQQNLILQPYFKNVKKSVFDFTK